MKKSILLTIVIVLVLILCITLLNQGRKEARSVRRDPVNPSIGR